MEKYRFGGIYNLRRRRRAETRKQERKKGHKAEAQQGLDSGNIRINPVRANEGVCRNVIRPHSTRRALAVPTYESSHDHGQNIYTAQPGKVEPERKGSHDEALKPAKPLTPEQNTTTKKRRKERSWAGNRGTD
jgi:hypothetical protein